MNKAKKIKHLLSSFIRSTLTIHSLPFQNEINSSYVIKQNNLKLGSRDNDMSLREFMIIKNQEREVKNLINY